jgi:radical SAM superfamily enzyme YgiQ (UPF0313 family)
MKRPAILLVNPWIHDFAAYDLWARPMGLLVIGSILRRQGWEPTLFDCLDTGHPETVSVKVKAHAHGHFQKTAIEKPEPLQQFPRVYSRYGLDLHVVEKDLLSIPRPEAIMVTSLMTYWYPGIRETIDVLKKVFPGVPVLLGGIYASLLPKHAVVHTDADEVLPGPGETTLAKELYRITGKGSAHGRSRDLECTPALDLLRHQRFLPLMTSRGCPFQCSYCASKIMVPRYTRRNVDDVIHEIETIHAKHGTRDIALYDDAFLVDAPSHALPMMERVAEKLPGMRWHTPNGLHASAIDQRVASAMKVSGFETIRIGLETTTNRFHAQTGGKTSLEDFLSAVRHLREVGFNSEQIGVYLLVGVPGQSRTQIEDDVDLVLTSGAHPKLAEYSPIPGTQMWSQAVRTSRYPIAKEPLYHNCTLLPAAEDDVDSDFLQATRKGIRKYLTG